MIFIMSQKFYEKKKEKLACYDYVAVDTENISVSGRKTMDRQLSAKYPNFVTLPSMTPETHLYEWCRRLKRGETVNKMKFERELDFYFNDTAVISQYVRVMKLLLLNNGNKNVYVVFTNPIYAVLGRVFCDFFNKVLFGESFDIAFKQEQIKEDSSILQKRLTDGGCELVKRRIKKLNKKYKLKYDGDDDD